MKCRGFPSSFIGNPWTGSMIFKDVPCLNGSQLPCLHRFCLRGVMDKQHADSLVVPPRQALVSVRSPQPPRQWLPGGGHLRNLCSNDSNDAVVDVFW